MTDNLAARLRAAIGKTERVARCDTDLATNHGTVHCDREPNHDSDHHGRCWACAEEDPDHEWLSWSGDKGITTEETT